jgi:hypothetical protein
MDLDLGASKCWSEAISELSTSVADRRNRNITAGQPNLIGVGDVSDS